MSPNSPAIALFKKNTKKADLLPVPLQGCRSRPALPCYKLDLISTLGGGTVTCTSQQTATSVLSRDADSQRTPRKLVCIMVSTWKPKEGGIAAFGETQLLATLSSPRPLHDAPRAPSPQHLEHPYPKIRNSAHLCSLTRTSQHHHVMTDIKGFPCLGPPADQSPYLL